MDFEIIEYSRYKLKIIGSIDISSAPNIEIVFKDVFFASTVFNWKTDTSCKVISLVKGDEAKKSIWNFKLNKDTILLNFKQKIIHIISDVFSESRRYSLKNFK